MTAPTPGRLDGLLPWLALGAGALLVSALLLSAVLGPQAAGSAAGPAPGPAAGRPGGAATQGDAPEAAGALPAPTAPAAGPDGAEPGTSGPGAGAPGADDPTAGDPTAGDPAAGESPAGPGAAGDPSAEHASALAGLSTWVDLYDVQRSPEAQVAAAAGAGVEVLYAQAARYNSTADIHDPARLGALLEAAHDRGLRVVTWYIPDFTDPDRARRRALAAARFTSPRGDRPDGFGLDIELDTVPDVALRTARLLELTAALHAELAGELPLAAIVLPPLQLELNTTWWPGYPYARLRPHFDVFVPMSYSSFRGTDAATTYEWNLANVRELRRLTDDPALPVHLAGGLADDLPEVAAFVDAARDGGAIGGGLYDLETTPEAAWTALQPLRAEALDAP